MVCPQEHQCGARESAEAANAGMSVRAPSGWCWHSNNALSISGTTMVASHSMTNIGVSLVSLSHVIFSLGVAPEYEPYDVVESEI